MRDMGLTSIKEDPTYKKRPNKTRSIGKKAKGAYHNLIETPMVLYGLSNPTHRSTNAIVWLFNP